MPTRSPSAAATTAAVSEYSINGQNVRLKDVYELLLDTGIGRDGYAIVGQGRIAEIVGAKSAERREIFEEASGIAKYRYRKNEAERRLEAAEGNPRTPAGYFGRTGKRVGPLKRDSEKAQQFLELSSAARAWKSLSGSMPSAAPTIPCATSSASLKPPRQITNA